MDIKEPRDNESLRRAGTPDVALGRAAGLGRMPLIDETYVTVLVSLIKLTRSRYVLRIFRNVRLIPLFMVGVNTCRTAEPELFES